MHFGLALLVVCACGRVGFGPSEDGGSEAFAIVSPPDRAQVQGSASLTGTCFTGSSIALGGSGLEAPAATTCADGAFSVTITFTEADGEKLVTVTQGGITLSRTFLRVTPSMLKSTSSGTKGSSGPTVDCDLVIPAPAERTAGDLLLGMIYTDGGFGASVSTPGFTRTSVQGGTYVAFWKIVSSVEPSTYAFHVVAGTDPSDTCESAGVLAVFSRVDAALPILAEAGGADADDTTVVAPSVTAPMPAILVGAWGSNGPDDGFTQAGMTVAAVARSSDDNASVLVAFERLTAAGPTGVRVATLPVPRAAAAGLFVINGKP